MQIDKRIVSAFRQLTDGEFDTLLASIEEHGVLTPVIVWDEADTLVDGHHRVAIAEELGIDYPVKRMHFADIDDAINFADRLQAGRRNESKEDRDERIRKMRAAGMTYQKIADEVGVSVGFVHKTAKDVVIFTDEIENERNQRRPAHYKTRQAQDDEDDEEAPPADEAPPSADEAPPPAKRPHVANNSGNNEWYTPARYIESARRVLGRIDLDPASSVRAQEVVRADVFYTVEDDGLAQPWRGRVWLNPPYASELIKKFAAKVRRHVESGDVDEAIILVNNATETRWFRDLVSVASAIVFPESRVKFWKANGDIGAPLQGQAFIYIGENELAFLAEFKQYGWGCNVRH